MPSAVRKLILPTLAAAGLALALSGAAAAEPSPLEPAQPAGPNAQAIADIYWVVFWVALGLFALVVAALVVALARSRRRAAGASAGPDLPEPGPLPLRRLAAFSAIPLAGLAVVTIAVFVKLSDARDAPAAGAAGTLAVQVEGSQAGWKYTYANGVAATDRLRVPTGATVRLTISSADVQHAFWVPQLAGQVRVFPGETRQLAFRADRDGVFTGRSTVPSGAGYERMGIAVEAMPKADYDAWLQQAAAQKGGSS